MEDRAFSPDKNHPSPPLLQQAEFLVNQDSPCSADYAVPATLEESKKWLQELRLYKIELEMQNEELRRIQWELHQAKQRYQDLFDYAPVAYFTIDSQGLILDANLLASELLGLEKRFLLNQALRCYIHPEDESRYTRHRLSLLENGCPQALDMRLLRESKQTVWVRMNGSRVQGQGPLTPSYRITASDITDTKQLEQQKDTLQHELYHRSRNNLQIISSLVSLQALGSLSKETKKELLSVVDRVNSMASVYDLLFDIKKSLSQCTGRCLQRLARQIGEQLKALNPNVFLGVDIDPVCLDPKICTALGMILHEALTNAYQHAFPNQKSGRIKVSLKESTNLSKSLTIKDDGVGRQTAALSNSLGLKIIRLLAEQVEADLQLTDEAGFTIELIFT